MRNARLVLVIPAGLAMALVASPARGSCAAPPGLAEHLASADVVFVGTVVELSNADRTAVVAVEETWTGPALAATITVQGGPDDPTIASSVDRTFVLGGHYLFAVLSAEGKLWDNICSATREWVPELAAMRPDEVSRPPEATEPISEERFPVATLVVGAVALLLAGVSVLAFRARR